MNITNQFSEFKLNAVAKTESEVVEFDELFDINELQKLQDLFSNAFGVASIITKPDGTPITNPSRFTNLCNNIIRNSERGLHNCKKSDMHIGRQNFAGPNVEICLSCGLWDAGASINIGEEHVANWLIGQVRGEYYEEQNLRKYARTIEVNEDEFLSAFREVNVMSREQFNLIAGMLFTMAGQLSAMAFKNLEQAKIIRYQKKIEAEIKLDEERIESLLAISSYQPTDIADLFRFALSESVKITGSSLGYIYLYSEETKELVLDTTANNQIANTIPFEIRQVLSVSEMGIWGEVVNQRKPYTIEHLSENPGKLPFAEGIKVEITRSLILPVQDSGRLVAIVIVANKTSEYSDADIRQILLMIDAVWKIFNRIRTSILHWESESKFRSLFENSPIGKSITKIDGTIDVNKAFCEMLGYTQEELTGKKFRDITHPDDLKITDELLEKLLNGEQTKGSVEKRYIHKNGSIVWVVVSVFLQRDKDGKPDYFITIVNDITRKKEMEEALRESEFFFRETQKAGFIGSYRFDVGNGSWDSSDVLDNIFGIDKKFNRNIDGWVELIHPEDQDCMSKYLLEDVIGKGFPFNREYRIIRKSDKVQRWVLGLGSLVFNAEGKVQYMLGTIQDITERKDAEHKQLRLMNIIDRSLNEVYLFDADSMLFEYFNQGAIQNLGYSASEIRNLTPVDLLPGFNQTSFKALLNPLLTGEKQSLVFESYHLRKDGGTYPVEVHLQVHDYYGEKTIIAIANDISDKKKAEIILRRQEEEYRMLVQNLHVAIVVHNPDTTIKFANDNASLILGINTTHLQGKSAESPEWHFIDQNEQPLKLEDYPVNKILSTHYPVHDMIAGIFRPGTGDLVWVLINAFPDLDEDGNLLQIVVSFVDITHQKNIEANLRESEARYQSFINADTNMIFVKDSNFRYLMANNAMAGFFKTTKEELLGKTDYELADVNTILPCVSSDINALSSQSAFTREETLGDRIFEVTKFPLQLSGNRKGVGGIMRDITSRKQMEADLIIAKEKAEESDRLKSAFLANMSHEIRTPLNSVIGFSELLADPSFDADQKDEFVQHIIQNGNYLLNIISDIVDLSKIEAGEITIRKRPIKVHDLVEEVKRMFGFKIEEKSLNFIVNTPAGIEKDLVLCDRERIMQIFGNLLNNALKFTKEGSIEIGYRSLATKAEFYVKDSGIGIPEEFHHKVFDRFRQVETSYNRRFGGNGLGLSISKNLIELMDGRIWLESKPGEGSTFFFTLEKC